MLKPAEIYTHTHTHTQLKRCRDFLCKLCLGAVLIFAPIFSFSATLPSGYTELEYIESADGNQYIDTGLVQNVENINIKAKFQFLGDVLGSIISQRGASSGLQLQGHIQQGTSFTGFRAWIGNLLADHSLLPNQHDIVYTEVSCNHGRCTITVNGSVIYNDQSYDGSIQSEYSYYLFGSHRSTGLASVTRNLRIYNLSIEVSGVKVRDMVPAMNPSGVVGMYDTVNDVFYTNSGTGTFTAGPEIVEETYTFLEYIDIDSDYIDTGLYLYTDAATNHYPNIHYTFMPLRYRTDSTTTNYVGGRSSGLGWGGGVLLGSGNYNSTNCSYIDYFDGSRYVGNEGTNVQLNTKYEYDIVNKSATLKDITNNTTLLSHTFGNSTERSDNSLTINALPGCGTGICTGNNKLRIYDFEVEGEAHMIPAKRNSDGVIGMYDTVRNQFYTNTGVGTITAGPAVAQPTTVEIIWGGLAEPDASGTCTYGETFTAPSTAPTAPSGLKFLGWRPIGQ